MPINNPVFLMEYWSAGVLEISISDSAVQVFFHYSSTPLLQYPKIYAKRKLYESKSQKAAII